MLYLYLVLSAVLVPILDNFFEILRQDYSWWLVPLLFVCFFIGFILLHVIVFILSFLFVSYDSPQERGAKYYRFLEKTTLPLILTLAKVKINIKGLNPDELPTDTKYLFVCNHRHDFDPLIVMRVFEKHNIGFIGKKEIFESMFLVGKIMHKLYGLPIDRENNREGAKTIIKAIKIINEDKASIGLFPEGYTNLTEEKLLPFRNGAFKIAYKANVPIVVCTVLGTPQIPKRMFRKTTVIDFSVLKVFYPQDFKDLSTAELGEKIHNIMEKELS